MNIYLLKSKKRLRDRKAKILSRIERKPFEKGFNETATKTYSKIQEKNEDNYINIFESEIESMAAAANSQDHLETGGELFGLFSHNGRPVILLATPPGEKAIHHATSFQQDYRFFLKIANILKTEYGVCFSGNHHSHWSLNLKTLSGLDIQNLNTIAKKNNLKNLCQILLTFENGDEKENFNINNEIHAKSDKRLIQLHSYFYPDAINGKPVKCQIKILPGKSPVRRAIERDPYLMEFFKPNPFPLSRIIYDEYKSDFDKNKNNLPLPIRDQLNIFMETFNKSISMTFESDWIIFEIPIFGWIGSLFVVFKYLSPFNIESVYFQANFISKNPVNISDEILKNKKAHTSLKLTYSLSRKVIIKHYAAKKRCSR